MMHLQTKPLQSLNGKPKATVYSMASRRLRLAVKQVSVALLFFVVGGIVIAEDGTPKFRTDNNPDKNLPWFHPVKGKFPPAGSAASLSFHAGRNS